ncbi:roadblock/LC7 domain-containing protein [Streptomyces sp. OR43]|uniref:roadblock/LC7 domain-containing protein n=1 Tax=Streptomyces sp. or43 TaxID=2478957 RepID=UPI0011CDF511|nr:roadblock/LC7 domain-containing protein [Streptomyces sp. or43]TXS38786.1 roadblock/LC7 domain-containing protein [Streptomyces sp. or43]
MTRTTATHQDLDWLLDGLVDSVAETLNAVLLSDDGLVVSHSRTVERSDAERLAAICTGQQSLARGVGQLFNGGDVHQVIVELSDLWLFIISAAQGTHLAVVASQEVDAEIMSLAMHNLVQQVGQKLSTPVRGDFNAFGGGDGPLA